MLGETTKRRVGLIWSTAEETYRCRNLRGGIELADAIAARWDGPEIVDFTQLLHDFSDTAALMEQMNLIITVDTSSAHLAGALGRPVWLLNCFSSCWRWLLDRTDSPWCPTVRLYRQKSPGARDGVIEKVRGDLDSIEFLGK